MRKVLLMMFMACALFARAQDKLPLAIVPAKSGAEGAPLLFLMSGDGGWNQFTAQLAEAMAVRGYNVVGLDSKKYFWKANTPQRTARVVNRVISYNMHRFRSHQYILAGFSFGACIVPFVANRTPKMLSRDLNKVVMISPDVTGDFEVHWMDMLNLHWRKGAYNVIDELARVTAPRPIIVFGKKENDDITAAFQDGGFDVNVLPGDHHYDGDAELVAGFLEDKFNGAKSSGL